MIRYGRTHASRGALHPACPPDREGVGYERRFAPAQLLIMDAVMTQPTWTQSLESADDAWRRDDLPALARATRRLVSGTRHDLQYELVAVAELASLGEPSAISRWYRLALQLRGARARVERASVDVAV